MDLFAVYRWIADGERVKSSRPTPTDTDGGPSRRLVPPDTAVRNACENRRGRILSTLTRFGFIAITITLAFDSPVKAQIAFAPNVSSFPNGVTLNVTPVVSHDRRYVRMSMNPIFNSLQGFDSYSVPFAVSGQGGAGGGGGGLGGLGGGGLGGAGGLGGGAGGGFRSVTFNAGMNGVDSGGGYPISSYASAEASSILSGGFGYAAYPPDSFYEPQATPQPRGKAIKKPSRPARAKKASPSKNR